MGGQRRSSIPTPYAHELAAVKTQLPCLCARVYSPLKGNELAAHCPLIFFLPVTPGGAILFAVCTREAQHIPGACVLMQPMHAERACAASSSLQLEQQASPEVFQRYKQKERYHAQ